MTYWNKNKIVYKHNNVFPQKPIRCLIIGSSGSGKTSLLLKLIIEDYIDFDRLFIASASVFQDEYQILIESYKYGLENKHIHKIFENQNEISNYKKAIQIIARSIPDYDRSHKEVEVIEDSNEIPPPEKLRKDGTKTLFILDDMLTKSQEHISELFVYSRPANINVIYLSQSYFKLDRHTIRLNSNFFIFFKLNKLDLFHVWQDLASLDIKGYSHFEALIDSINLEKYSFFSINLEETNINKKYLQNLKYPLIDIMNKLSIDDYHQNQLKAYNANKDLMNSIKSSRNATSAFQIQQSEVLKPVIEPIKKMEQTIKQDIPKAIANSREIASVTKGEAEEYEDDDRLEEHDVMELIQQGNDDLFGIVRFDDGIFRLGVYEKFVSIVGSKKEPLYYIGDHWLEFDYELQLIIVYRDTQKRNKEKRDFMLSNNLMLYLTKDISTTYLHGARIDETSKVEYLEIINFAIGRELEKIKKAVKAKPRADLLTLFRRNQKFKDIIAPKYSFKGEGYKGISTASIVISPEKSQQLKRLLVLLGSKNAGNDNPDGLKEYTAILDELLNKNDINKLTYKILLYKYLDKSINDPR
jgi:GTPase SAR1 family protein